LGIGPRLLNLTQTGEKGNFFHILWSPRVPLARGTAERAANRVLTIDIRHPMESKWSARLPGRGFFAATSSQLFFSSRVKVIEGKVTLELAFDCTPRDSSHILSPCFAAGASSDVGHFAQVETAPASVQKSASTRIARWQLLALGILVGWVYYSVLLRLVHQWEQDPNFSHGFFVPAFSLFVLWRNRSRLAALPHRPSWWGLPVIALALGVLVLGDLGAELFLSRFSLLLVLAGLIVLFFGWSYFRAILFPWAFLILMIPLPTIVFNQITFPLQILASKIAAKSLPLCGVPVLREGNVINLPAMALEVAEACSGIRSLVSLLTLAVIYGYLMETRVWVRVALAIASLPIVVAANSMRIVGTGLLVQYWNPDKAEGFFHLFSGWLIFVASLTMLYLVHQLLTIDFGKDKTRG